MARLQPDHRDRQSWHLLPDDALELFDAIVIGGLHGDDADGGACERRHRFAEWAGGQQSHGFTPAIRTHQHEVRNTRHASMLECVVEHRAIGAAGFRNDHRRDAIRRHDHRHIGTQYGVHTPLVITIAAQHDGWSCPTRLQLLRAPCCHRCLSGATNREVPYGQRRQRCTR